MLTTLLIAISLALDVGVVSVGAGALNALTLRRAFLIAFIFGAFHAVMPLIGWGVEYGLHGYVVSYSRYIGFALLLFIGINMLRTALGKEDVEQERNLMQTRTLIVLAFATSIDALVIGFTFNTLQVPIVLGALIIGGVTFLISLLGAYIGRASHHLIGTKVEFFGAAALIALAFKTLLF